MSECNKCGGYGLVVLWSSGVSARCECQRDEPHRSEKASNVMITLNVIPPRKGSIRVSYDGDGVWFVKCNYFHRGEWVYDQGLMTTAPDKTREFESLVSMHRAAFADEDAQMHRAWEKAKQSLTSNDLTSAASNLSFWSNASAPTPQPDHFPEDEV